MIRQRRGIEMQRWITNDQRGVIFHQHFIQIRRKRRQHRATVVAFGEQNPRQRHRSARARIHRQSPDLSERLAGGQQDASDRPITGNPQIRQEIEAEAVEFGARQQADSGLAVPQRLGAVNGQVEAEIEDPFLGPVKKSPDQRPGVEVADGGNDQSSV